MTVKVLFKDGCYVEYNDITECVESIMFSGFICLTDIEGVGIYLNMNEITSFKIKEATYEIK